MRECHRDTGCWHPVLQSPRRSLLRRVPRRRDRWTHRTKDCKNCETSPIDVTVSPLALNTQPEESEQTYVSPAVDRGVESNVKNHCQDFASPSKNWQIGPQLCMMCLQVTSLSRIQSREMQRKRFHSVQTTCRSKSRCRGEGHSISYSVVIAAVVWEGSTTFRTHDVATLCSCASQRSPPAQRPTRAQNAAKVREVHVPCEH